jgi:hypothetical protein
VRLLYLAWSTTLLFATAPSALLVLAAASQWGWEHARPAALAATLCALPALWCIFQSARELTIPTPHFVPGISVTLGLLTPLSPAITRLLLPWEEPETGIGSPLASLMSIVMLGMLAAPHAITGMIGLLCFSHQSERARVRYRHNSEPTT